MAGAPFPEDGTTGLTDEFSHVSLDQFSSYNANSGASYLDHQAASALNADTYFPDPSDFYESTTTQPPPPYDPSNPYVCSMYTSRGEVCNQAFQRECDLT